MGTRLLKEDGGYRYDGGLIRKDGTETIGKIL